MSKASDFIRDYTKRCSNAIAQAGDKGNFESGAFEVVYQPWLTPENALAAVEIERQEVIERAKSFFEDNLTEEECKFGISEWIEVKTSYESIDSFIRAFEHYIKGE